MTNYIKTRKGMDELIARRNGIDSRLNSVLMLIDGKRSTEEIQAVLAATGMPADTLDILLHGGYIVENQRSVETPVRKAATVQNIERKAIATPAPVSAVDKVEHQEFQALYEYLVKRCKESLGLRGFALQLKIERAQDAQSLHSLIEPLSEAIAKRHGLQVTNDFLRETAQLTAKFKTERQGLRLIADRRVGRVPDAAVEQASANATPAQELDFSLPSEFQQTVAANSSFSR